MEDQLISFETAKLAKEKGFDVFTNKVYNQFGSLFIFNSGLLAGHDRINAPTQSLLQKWLRDEHLIHIDLQYSRTEDDESIEWWFYLYDKIGEGRVKFFPDQIGNNLTYEEPLEIGLQKALKLIK
jgi:hypothetical protein